MRFVNSYALLPPMAVRARNQQATQTRKMHIANPHQKSGTKTTTSLTGILLCHLGAGFLMGIRDVRFSRLLCLSIPCLHCYRWKHRVRVCKSQRISSTDNSASTKSTSNASELIAHRISPSKIRHQEAEKNSCEIRCRPSAGF